MSTKIERDIVRDGGQGGREGGRKGGRKGGILYYTYSNTFLFAIIFLPLAKNQKEVPSLSVAVLKERVRNFKEEAIVGHITKSEGKVRGRV